MIEHITRELVTEWAYGRIDIELAESSDDGDIAIYCKKHIRNKRIIRIRLRP